MRNLIYLFVIISLFACNSLSSPASPPPTGETIIQPSATPTAIPSPTATEFFPTLPPVPTTDSNFFREDFDGNLAAPWIWVREDPRNWSLMDLPGSLLINVRPGYVVAHSNSNLLLRPAPTGNFLVETRLTFKPFDNFQFAGLIIYQSDSNFIQAGQEFCNAVGCAGKGLYMDTYRKGVIVPPSFGPTSQSANPIWLRLSRKKEAYVFQASTDGRVWFAIESQTSDLDPAQIGLVTGQLLRGKSPQAAFDYFEVRSLP
jgi:regulation of enolase protein 1 (concanavalin A-like superfamily)